MMSETSIPLYLRMQFDRVDANGNYYFVAALFSEGLALSSVLNFEALTAIDIVCPPTLAQGAEIGSYTVPIDLKFAAASFKPLLSQQSISLITATLFDIEAFLAECWFLRYEIVYQPLIDLSKLSQEYQDAFVGLLQDGKGHLISVDRATESDWTPDGQNPCSRALQVFKSPGNIQKYVSLVAVNRIAATHPYWHFVYDAVGYGLTSYTMCAQEFGIPDVAISMYHSSNQDCPGDVWPCPYAGSSLWASDMCEPVPDGPFLNYSGANLAGVFEIGIPCNPNRKIFYYPDPDWEPTEPDRPIFIPPWLREADMVNDVEFLSGFPVMRSDFARGQALLTINGELFTINGESVYV